MINVNQMANEVTDLMQYEILRFKGTLYTKILIMTSIT